MPRPAFFQFLTVICALAWLSGGSWAGGQSTLAVAAGECVDGQCHIDNAAPLLSFRKSDAATANPLRPQAEPRAVIPQYADPAPVTPPTMAPRFDARVLPAAAAESVPQLVAEGDYAAAPSATTNAQPAAAVAAPAPLASYDASDRRLAPPSASRSSGSTNRASRTPVSLAPLFAQLKSLSSAGGGLAIVIALLVASVWLLRRSGPKPTGALPAEAFAVLGRAPLTAQSFAQLLRIGNKLVLVAVSADGAHPLAEVTDAAEVDRIAGLCLGGRSGGSSAEFQQVLAQLSREPARGFLGREGSAARRRSS